MLFDEPTSALDPEMVKEVLDTMRRARRGGHDDAVRDPRDGLRPQVANRVVFMDAGEIVEVSEPGAFFNHPASERARTFLYQILH